MAVASRAMPMLHTEDPKTVLLEKLGDLSTLNLDYNYFMVATYKRPKVTASGIHIPDKTREEDRFQSSIGLIVAMGPRAFADDENFKFLDSERRKVGDWVIFNPSTGYHKLIKDVDVRIFTSEKSIYGTVAHPDDVY